MSPDWTQLCNSHLNADAPPPSIFTMEEEATPARGVLITNNRNSFHPSAIVIPKEFRNQNQSASPSLEIVSSNDKPYSFAQLSSSFHSSSTQSLSHASNTTTSRRDSGFSSKPLGSSRSSSKHSIPSAREIYAGDDTLSSTSPLRRPNPRRAISTSRMPTSYERANVIEALALHERGVQLFGPTSTSSQTTLQENPFDRRRQRANTLSQSPSTSLTDQLSTSLPSSLVSPSDSIRRSRQARLSRTQTLPPSIPVFPPRPMVPRTQSAAVMSTVDVQGSCHEHDEPFVPATIMQWTSNETRRREYDAIDRQSRGLRGIWNKIRPRVFKGKQANQPGFYDPEKNTSNDDDVGSVRRYRLHMDEE